MKACPKCGETKPISDFYRNAKRHDGLAGWCIPCANRAGTDSVAKMRRQAIAHLGGGCIRCGYSIPGPALQIDHVNGDGHLERKTQATARAILRAALADTGGRYQLLCANCNQIKRMENAEHVGSRVYTRQDRMDDPRVKFCSRCATSKPVQEFHANQARRDGLSVYCDTCTVARGREEMKRMRAEVVAHLGGQCLACWYDTDRRALQVDHVNGDGSIERTKLRNGGLLRAVLADTEGRYQLLCANCNVIKRAREGEHRPRETYSHTPATERRSTRKYLTPEDIAEVARLVAVCGIPQATVGKRFGISQPTVAVHTRNAYPDYQGRQARRRRESGDAQ